MKRNKSLLLILLFLIIASIYFIYRQNDSTIRQELRDFAVKDTAAITKIFLADRNKNTVTLQKINGNWVLNGKFEPKKDLVELLLDGIARIQVKSKVANAAYNNVIKALAAGGIKCEIYLNSEPIPEKVYYVGGSTEDSYGTFMMLENSAAPFITEVPGFNGYLTPRYNPDPEVWKSTRIFGIAPDDISSLSVMFYAFPKKSYTILSDNGHYRVFSPVSNEMISNIDSIAVENYLALFRNVFFEGIAKNHPPEFIDSILHTQPFIEVALTDKSHKNKVVELYPMPISTNSLTQTDSLGKPLKYDLDRMYGYILPDKDFVIIQHYVFDKILRQIDDFKGKRKG